MDLGGTKIEAIVMADDGRIVCRNRVNTPKDDYQATLVALGNIIKAVSQDAGIADDVPVGIGSPGAVSLKTGLMMNCNSTCLNNQPLREDLQTLIKRPVRIANDADCFTLSEASDGAAMGEDIVFGVILGTGVGGGIVFQTELAQGVNAICGEWGHNSLPLENILPAEDRPGYSEDSLKDCSRDCSRDCFCGRKNCIETWLAGPAFELSYYERSQQKREAADIVALAEKGDPAAMDCLAQYCNMLALALSNVINILDPGIIVLGGGMSNTDRIYETLPQLLPRYVFSDQINTRIVKAMHGDSSGVRGAAWLWRE